MTRNTKILLGVLAGLLLLCLCSSITAVTLGGWLISRAGTVQPSSVTDIGSEIADFDLPSGWAPDYALNVIGIKVAAYRPEDGAGHIILAQVPEGISIDASKLEADIRSAARNRGYTWLDEEMRVVGEQAATVRGKATTLTVAESSGSSGPYRQVTAAFEGKGGPAWLMVAAPIDEWDQATVDTFIASIR